MCDKRKFGVEIEFEGLGLMKLYPALISSGVPTDYCLQHKIRNTNYDKWVLDIDNSVTQSISRRLIGGELSSRILEDSDYVWNEVSTVCNLLQKMKAVSTDRCSTHVTMDISDCLDNPKFFEIFSKILAVYETDISLFYMGDSYKVRKTKEDYATSMVRRLQKNIEKVDFSKKDFLDSLLKNTGCFKLRDGVSFTKLKSRGLVEFRYPNGTFCSETIKNYVHFTLDLIESIKKGKFDLDYLNYLISEDKDDYFQFIRNLKFMENFDRFEELLSIIGNEDETDNYYNQYQKVLSSR